MERIRIIFVDVDGVLNSNSTRVTTSDGWCFVEDILVERLARIVREADAKVVLSSTWRDGWHREREETNEPFFIDLRQKLREHGIELFDRTGTLIPGYFRGLEIDEWIKSRNDLEIENFIILDDFNDMMPYRDHLLQTSAITGLTDSDVEIAINYLSAPAGSYDLEDMDNFTFWVNSSETLERCGVCNHIFNINNDYRHCPWCGRHVISQYDYVNLIWH